MNRKVQLIIKLSLFVFPLLAQTGPRKVAWVHGFGGKFCSLQALDDHFQSKYDISSLRLQYNTQKGIESSGSVIARALHDKFDPRDARNLGVGHSMGGLNLRYSEISDPSLSLGGVITIGTPHAGAALASKYLNGELDDFVNKMADDLLAGPKADKLTSALLYKLDPKLDIPLIRLLNKEEFTVTDLIGLFAKGNAFDFFNYLLDSESTIKDLVPGNPSLEMLDNIESDRNAYVIWGDEDSPVHWRFLSSLISSSCEEQIGESTDEILLDKIRMLRNLYHGLEAANRVMCQMAYFITFGLGNKKSIRLCILANKYARGKNWVIDSEEHWLKLIGATYQTRASVTVSIFTCQKQLELARLQNNFHLVSELMNNEDCWLVHKEVRTVSLKEASDGLVTRQSACAYPEATAMMRAKGANHFELLYHESVKDALETIINNENDWSYIVKR